MNNPFLPASRSQQSQSSSQSYQRKYNKLIFSQWNESNTTE